MTGSMECFTLQPPDFGRQGPLGLGDAGFGSLGCGRQGLARRCGAWPGMVWQAGQAWLVQDCCGASGRVKVRYVGAGKARYVMSWSGAAWKDEVRQARRVPARRGAVWSGMAGESGSGEEGRGLLRPGLLRQAKKERRDLSLLSFRSIIYS